MSLGSEWLSLAMRCCSVQIREVPIILGEDG